jgi:hypothetical protein
LKNKETDMDNTLESHLNKHDLDIFQQLDTPEKIQEYLDMIPYSAEDANRCTVNVLRDKKAHCLDGGLFAAAALKRAGHSPLIIDMLPDPGKDDDHVLAIYKKNGRWGSLAKSNYVGLRYREPVYISLRELVMSYFDVFYNVFGEKTLRYYTRPINLKRFDSAHWEWDDKGADAVERYLKTLGNIPLISPEMAAGLAPMDRRSYDAHMMGSDPLGLYKPKKTVKH